MTADVLINFRRKDSDKIAPHLDTALRREFGDQRIFRDRRSIEPGQYYPAELEAVAAGCRVVLAVMGPQWATLTDGHGRRLIDNEQDWVRKEIAIALRARRKVIPVLVSDAKTLPDPSELPADIRDLVMSQALHFQAQDEHLYLPAIFKAVRDAVPGLRRARRSKGPESGGSSVRTGSVSGSVIMSGGRGNRARVTNNPGDQDPFDDDLDEDEEFDGYDGFDAHDPDEDDQDRT